MVDYTTITVSKEFLKRGKEIKKEMKVRSYKEVIEKLFLIREEYIKIRGRKEYMDFLKKENLQIDDFVEDMKYLKLLLNYLKENYHLIPNDIFKKKYNIVPKENGS